MKPKPTVTSKIAKFTNFWPPKRTDLVIKPCSLAKAIKLPLKDTAPMKPPTAAMVRCTRLCSLPLYSSTAAMAAAAPPPMPLYSAIICGMSVMATRLPLTQAITLPIAMAPMTSIKLKEEAPMNASVTTRGEQHADAGPAHAADGGDRRTHALQSQNEQRRRDQIGKLGQGLNGRGGRHHLRSFLLCRPSTNIFSMRSVTT